MKEYQWMRKVLKKNLKKFKLSLRRKMKRFGDSVLYILRAVAEVFG